MKIILCRGAKDVEKAAKLLDRNLRKVTIDFKKCPPEYEGIIDTEVVAMVDGNVMHATSAYGLLKEIRKYLKKQNKLDLLDKSEMKKTKKEYKVKLELKKDQPEGEGKIMDMEKKKKNEDQIVINASLDGDSVVLDAPNEMFSLDHMKISVNFDKFGQENSTYEVVKKEEAIDAHIQGNKVVLDVPNENFRLEDMKISVNLGSFGDRNSTYEVLKADASGQIKAELTDEEIVLKVPNQQFSLDRMKVTVNFGAFGDQVSTYELVKKPASDDESIQAKKDARDLEVSQVTTFSAPEPKETKSPEDSSRE